LGQIYYPGIAILRFIGNHSYHSLCRNQEVKAWYFNLKPGGCVPLSRVEFEKGSDDTGEKIIALLSANPAQAFSLNEIVGGIYGDPPADVMEIIQRIPRLIIGVGAALEGLVDRGLLDRRIVDGITYYCRKRTY
jgi:hypothetical protein